MDVVSDERTPETVAREWYLKQDFMHCSDAYGGHGICAKCDEEVAAITQLLRAEREAAFARAVEIVGARRQRYQAAASEHGAIGRRNLELQFRDMADGCEVAAQDIAAAVRALRPAPET